MQEGKIVLLENICSSYVMFKLELKINLNGNLHDIKFQNIHALRAFCDAAMPKHYVK